MFLGISEIECVGGIYLGEESKVVEGFIVYDKFSGIYFGEDKGFSRKILIEEVSEGGILFLWYKNVERWCKIVSCEGGFYDERSGVYFGEELFLVLEFVDEGVIIFVLGGILEWFFIEIGFDLFLVNKEIKMLYWRNYSEGNFLVVFFGEKDLIFEILDVKWRVVFNVDCIGFLLKFVIEYFVDEVCVFNGVGLRFFYKYIVSVFSEYVL